MARILAVSSSGGHWEQLMLIRDAFADHEVTFANTLSGLAERSGVGTAEHLADFNAKTPFKALIGIWRVVRLVCRVRPELIVSTGAAPGVIALATGKALGCTTVWIDSVANSEKLSLSGRIATLFADVSLTQWEHLARPNGPAYRGTVL